MGFIFGGNTPWTYEQLQSKRRIAEELMAANMGTPRNVGEGLTAIGRALAIRGINKKADKRDAELKGEYDTARGAVLSALMGGAPGAAPSMAAPGMAAPVDPNSPQGVANDTMKALGKAPDFSALEAQYGLPAGYLERTAMIESGGNPNAQNPNSSAGGMFQFIDSTAKQYGLTDKTDPLASADAAARLAADNRAYLAKALGREPTAGELYLAHQQGAGGAAKLLAAGNAPAASIVGGDAVGLNGGNAGMTAADFAGKWTGKFGETVQPANADIGTIADLLANPYATPGDKAILGALLQQRMDAADPMKRLEMERAQLELEALRNPQAKEPDAVRSRVMLAERAGLTPDMPEYQGYILTGELPKPNGGSEFGLQPVYGRDKQGNIVVLQLGKNGVAVASDLPEGITPDLAVKSYEGAYGTETGKAAGAAMASAASDVQAAQNALDLIDSIRNDPARQMATGKSSFVGAIPGTASYDFNLKVDQAKSGAFMTAIQQLRGMGALSNTEGATATAAVTRMKTSMTEEGFLKALADYEKIVRQAMDKAQAKVDGAPVQGNATTINGYTIEESN